MALRFDEADPPNLAASAVLFQVVTTFVDHLIRTAAPRTGKDALKFVSQHDQWIQALRSESGRMTGDAAELAQTRRGSAAVAAADRACRVGAVPALLTARRAEVRHPRRHDQWRVGYLLQAMDDQSLLVPVKSAWKCAGVKPSS